MKRPSLSFASILLFISFFYCLKSSAEALPSEDNYFKPLNWDKTEVRYDLNQIINCIEDSIFKLNKVIIPKDVTEYEQVLFRARRIQHNDSQLVAIKILRYLLEFEYYRNEGEKLYIQLLLANSLDYIGAPMIANNYLNNVFPKLLDYVERQNIKGFYLSHYGEILIKIDSLEKAKSVYEAVIKISKEIKDIDLLVSTRNNYGYVLKLLQEYDSAEYYFRLNQDTAIKSINPILYAFSFGNYASVLLDYGKLDSAIYFTKKEVSLLKKIGVTEGLAKAYSSIGKAYLKKENLDSAGHYFKLSLSINENNDRLNDIIDNYESLLQLYALKEEKPLLKEFLKNYFNYNDSLKSILSFKTYSDELQVSKFMQIINEAQVSKRNFDQLKSDNRDLFFVIIALSVLVAGLILSLLSRRKSRKKVASANNELLKKNTELRHSYKMISESNSKNETLLRELHHRVKNNLQMISSLFNLQLNAQELDTEAARIFRAAQDRIYSISLIHKKIYQSENISTLNFEEYLVTFTKEIKQAYHVSPEIEIMLSDVHLLIDSAIPLGLIFNELFTNSLKHANATEPLQISIYKEDTTNGIKFIYIDNGIGVDPKLMTDDVKSSIGITLIHLLAKQLGAEIEFKSAKPGAYGFYFSIEGSF